MKVLAIPGSLRATSSNAAVLRAAADEAPAGAEVVVYAGLGELPHFSPDLDVDPLPDPVAALRAQIAWADALAISSPEYAHGMPGSLKNALDWLVSATEPLGKPVLLISASPSGAGHAHAQLLEVLRTMSLPVIDAGAHVFSRAKLDAAGRVTDPAVRAALAAGLRQLAAACAAAPLSAP
jgi:chromate reductase, NAD(P)H dehydrogenase (quinone)